jgi:hypothetical protein
MFKNTTRKGLAVGAAIALAFTGLAVTPAQAAGEVVLQPSSGSSYSTLVDQTFALQAAASGQANLKYKIDKLGTFGLTIGAEAAATTTLSTTSDTTAASTSFVVVPLSTSATVPNYITLKVTGASAASTSADVTVTAWIDSTPNGIIDSNEFSQVRTVSFKKYSDVVSVVALTQPLEGDTAIAGTVVLTDINLNQVQSTLNADVSLAGSATSSVAVTAGKFSAGFSALAKTATVSAVAVIGINKIGAVSPTYTVTAKSVVSVTNSPVVGANLVSLTVSTADARINSTFAVKAKVSSTTSKHVGVAGSMITVQVTTSATLTSTISLTINGTTYTDGTKLPTLELTSDAAGEALVTITPAGFAAAQTVTLITKSENNTTANYVVSQQVAAYTATNDQGLYLKTTLGGSATIGVTVKDQFDVALSRADRLAVTYNGATKYVGLVAGMGSVALTATTASGTLTVSANVQKQDTSNLNWGDATDVTDASDVNLLATATADAFDTDPSATTSAVISRVDANGDLTNAVRLTGSVNNAGALVTISGAGLKFSVSGTIVAGSVVAMTGNTGDFSVDVYSHTAGTATVTYTVGTATKSTVVTTAAAAYNTGKVIAITTNAVNGYSAPGSTFRATVTLVDEYGNPVAADNTTASFGVTITGPGFVGTLPTKTGADGSAAFSVLLGSADSGNIVVTATYDADGATTTVAAISATTTVTVGVAAVVVDQKVNVGSFKGYVALYAKGYAGQKFSAIVAGKWIVVESLDSGFERIVRFTGAGYDIDVKIYIDGMQVGSTFMVTTK